MGGADPRTSNGQYLLPALFSTDGARIIEYRVLSGSHRERDHGASSAINQHAASMLAPRQVVKSSLFAFDAATSRAAKTIQEWRQLPRAPAQWQTHRHAACVVGPRFAC
jgi:hypothetical protein